MFCRGANVRVRLWRECRAACCGLIWQASRRGGRSVRLVLEARSTPRVRVRRLTAVVRPTRDTTCRCVSALPVLLYRCVSLSPSEGSRTLDGHQELEAHSPRPLTAPRHSPRPPVPRPSPLIPVTSRRMLEPASNSCAGPGSNQQRS
jgi:hypothetical protein